MNVIWGNLTKLVQKRLHGIPQRGQCGLSDVSYRADVHRRITVNELVKRQDLTPFRVLSMDLASGGKCQILFSLPLVFSELVGVTAHEISRDERIYLWQIYLNTQRLMCREKSTRILDWLFFLSQGLFFRSNPVQRKIEFEIYFQKK